MYIGQVWGTHIIKYKVGHALLQYNTLPEYIVDFISPLVCIWYHIQSSNKLYPKPNHGNISTQYIRLKAQLDLKKKQRINLIFCFTLSIQDSVTLKSQSTFSAGHFRATTGSFSPEASTRH
jgi:hypothetical protein